MSKIWDLIKNEKVEWKTIGEVCKLIQGYSFSAKKFQTNGDYKIIRISNIKNDEIDTQNVVYVSKDEYKDVDLAKYKINQGDILIAMSGASVGKIGMNYSDEINLFLNQRVGKFLPNSYVLNNKYLYFWLSEISESLVKNIQNQSIANLSTEMILCYEIPIPSIDTQNKIVKILDKFNIYVKELEHELEHRNKQYKHYLNNLFRENMLSSHNDMFTYNSVKNKRLGDVCKIYRGASPRPINNFITTKDNGIPWIKIGDVDQNDKYVVNTKEFINSEGAKKSRLVSKGDFILSNSMSYGRPYILMIDGAVHDGWAVIKNYESELDSNYLYHYLLTDYVQNYWSLNINSGTVSNLNSEIIGSLKIPIICKNKQFELSKKLDKLKMIINDINNGLPKEIKLRKQQYEYYRNKLLDFPKN
ncbi:restriction endonuclease subunit S [Mycoplasmopsis anatis]|uniref:Restriction modification system DNA specificity domain protein n=1 Tax=Mycoplasmopsis anatis 1340 TaxID=1034808 RepID=F9QDY8_9BACT|nr:restriction endonuclease subunit S [Mycoplasmopsis anatis]AWX69865.1 restriction endonuclease subunit S [Mycoplasmopsis anatis]EGS29036.1 restriction modification system DNA specificity domain protein [Mycoplasmopsis anatis 1340]VEU73713.1 type I restriction-modification system, S subunit [Mycoplasmopsis anatis]